MRTTLFGVCLLLVGLSFPSSATPNDLFQKVIRTYEGKMTAQDQEKAATTTIFREGDSIAATLGFPDDPKLTMTLANYDLENRGLLFQWRGAESSTGYVVFWFSSNYESFEGTWGWDDSYIDGGNWTGRSVLSEEKKEEEAKRLAEEKKTEQERLAEEKRKKEEEAKRLAEEKKTEQERLAEEKRKKEEEAKRLAEEKKTEQERLAEEKKKNDLAALLATKKCISCNLTGVDLSNADLTGAKLAATDLRKSNLYRADLTGANLSGANLTGANLVEVNLTGANLRGAKGLPTRIRLVLAKERVKLNPGFRDLKPGLSFDEIRLMNICGRRGLVKSFSRCYDLDNIKFQGEFTGIGGKNSILRVLRIDLGPRVAGGGFIETVREMVDDDPILNMRGALESKYEMDYDWSERDRQLFNAGEKDELYTVYANGQVALLITRIEKEYSRDVWSYIEYRDPETAKRFLEANRPKKATTSDF